MEVKAPPKRPAFMSEDKKTGKKAKSDSFLNFKGGWKDPHFKAGAFRIDVDDRGGGINVRGSVKYKGGLKGLWKKIRGGND